MCNARAQLRRSENFDRIAERQELAGSLVGRFDGDGHNAGVEWIPGQPRGSCTEVRQQRFGSFR